MTERQAAAVNRGIIVGTDTLLKIAITVAIGISSFIWIRYENHCSMPGHPIIVERVANLTDLVKANTELTRQVLQEVREQNGG